MSVFDRLRDLRLPRRTLLAGGGLTVAATALGLSSTVSFSDREKGPAEVPVEELMKQVGDLPDIALGPADAKVTIVEYASMTCGHCMAFATKIFPDLKAKYIDTGKVRFIFREFPLDARAFAASMLARCAGSTVKSMALVDALFAEDANGTPR